MVVKIPLKQKRNNCYDEYESSLDTDNLVGVDNGNNWDFSISQLIDLSYKGDQQEGTPIIHFDDKEEFEEVCKKFGLNIIVHQRCNKCKGVIYGCSTLDKEGKIICLNCEK